MANKARRSHQSVPSQLAASYLAGARISFQQSCLFPFSLRDIFTLPLEIWQVKQKNKVPQLPPAHAELLRQKLFASRFFNHVDPLSLDI